MFFLDKTIIQKIFETKIFAHRGASAFYPENTIIAFSKAIEYGARYLECDLALSKDQKIIIIHDDHLKRTTGISGLVADFTKKQLIQIKADNAPLYKRLSPYRYGRLLQSKKKENFTIPSLGQLFALIQNYQKKDSQRKIILNLEIKKSCFRSEKVARNMLHQIRSEQKKYHLLSRQILISSFDWRFAQFARKETNYAIGLLIGRELPSLAHLKEITKKFGSVSIHPAVNYSVLLYKKKFRSFIENCHRFDIEVIPYTVNSFYFAHFLTKIGIDGFFTDRIDQFSVSAAKES